MDTDQLIDRVVNGRLTESLQHEFKQALDLTIPADRAKVICALIALWNNNGGALFVGVRDNGSIAETTEELKAKLRGFTSDTVQSHVVRHSSHPFPVVVTPHPNAQDPHFVLIEVPGGVRTPAVIKASLSDATQVALLTEGEIYVRTLRTGGRPSTAIVPWTGWNDLFETCFSNREADVGRLLRGLGPDIVDRLRVFLCTPATPPAPAPIAPPAAPPQVAVAPIPLAVAPVTDQTLFATMREVEVAAAEEMSQLGTDPSQFGSYSTLVVATIAGEPKAVNEANLSELMAANPNLTGWPPWLDSRSFADVRFRPRFSQRWWDAILPAPWTDRDIISDYWRIEPAGKLFVTRGYQDDLLERDPRTPPRGTQLDFGLVILRVAERLEVGRKLAMVLGAPPDSTGEFAFRFTKLRGRRLSNWANPARIISPPAPANQDEIAVHTTIQLQASQEQIVDATERVANRVFNLFGGYELSRSVIEDMTLRLLQRRL